VVQIWLVKRWCTPITIMVHADHSANEGKELEFMAAAHTLETMQRSMCWLCHLPRMCITLYYSAVHMAPTGGGVLVPQEDTCYDRFEQALG
jgi:hypothetical protein